MQRALSLTPDAPLDTTNALHTISHMTIAHSRPPAELATDTVYHGRSERVMTQIAAESVALSFWSPPYFVGKEYERDETFEDLAFTFANLALIKGAMGQPSEAEALFRKALTAARTHRHRNLAPVMTDLADVVCDQGRHVEAATLLRERCLHAVWNSE